MSGGSGVYKDLGFRDQGLHYIPNLDRFVVEELMLTSVLSEGPMELCCHCRPFRGPKYLRIVNTYL